MQFEKYVDDVVMKLASDGGARDGRLYNLMGKRSFVDFLHGTMGIASEIGELMDAYRKLDQCLSKVPDDVRLELLGEFGDIMFFVGLASRALGASVEVGQGVDTGSRAWSEAEVDTVVCAGELLSIAKARIFYDREISKEKAVVMLGHIVDGVRAMASEQGWTLHDVMGANVAKLSKRYPNFEFSDSRANNRNTDAEFKAME